MEKSFQLLTSGNLRDGGWDLEGWNEEIRRHPNLGDQLSNINTLRNFLKLFISKFKFFSRPLCVCFASITINLSTYLSKIFNLKSNNIGSSK